MEGVYIESAYYGDEKSFANITKSLVKKITGGVLDVTSSSELKPMFEAAPVTKLTPKDDKEIRELASKACGGEADQACLERTRIKLSEERLREKENENLVKGVIKGDRLTLNIVDKGRRRKLVAPAGQKVRLENIIGDKASDDGSLLPEPDKFQEYAITLLAVVASTFFWVFGIVGSYAVFMRQYELNPAANDYFRIIAYISAGLSVLFPGAGYVIILLYFGFSAFIKEYIAK
jgi:hypothetical protein